MSNNLEIPEILHNALRQYRHNNSDEFLAGFDYVETVKLVISLQEEINILNDIAGGLSAECAEEHTWI